MADMIVMNSIAALFAREVCFVRILAGAHVCVCARSTNEVFVLVTQTIHCDCDCCIDC